MNWKILVLSIFLTIIFFLTLMFYLGFDLDTFKRVALIQSLLVVVAIIFDYMERRKTPIFPGCIIYPLLGILFVFGFMPILDFFAERPQGFHSWDIKNILLINSYNTDYQFTELAWYGKALCTVTFCNGGWIFWFDFSFNF